jgi:hypothetical protein
MRFSVVLFGSVALLSCGPELHYETLAEDINEWCKNLGKCEYDVVPAEFMEKCEDELTGYGDLALEESVECANGFSGMITCIARLDCAESSEWGTYAAGNDPPEYSCKAQTQHFHEVCNSVWYAAD